MPWRHNTQLIRGRPAHWKGRTIILLMVSAMTVAGLVYYLLQALPTREMGQWPTSVGVVTEAHTIVRQFYNGERGSADEVLTVPYHPYTRGLLDSVPGEIRPGSVLPQIPGSTPSLLRLAPGCAFKQRCARADQVCDAVNFCDSACPPDRIVTSVRSITCSWPKITAAAAFWTRWMRSPAASIRETMASSVCAMFVMISKLYAGLP